MILLQGRRTMLKTSFSFFNELVTEKKKYAEYPFCVISELRVKQRSTPYAHTQKPEVEKYMNQTKWQENTLLETEEQPAPVIVSHTNTPQKQ
jgi:hypothetical protein